MKSAWLFFALMAGTLVFAQDSATVLARILASKGTISSSELASVESAAPGDRVVILAGLLQQKGVITRGEFAQFGGAKAPAVTKQLATSTSATDGSAGKPQVAEAPPVTSQSKLPITVYGTLLMNAFSDTSAMNIEDIPLFASKQGSDALGNDKSFGMTARQTRFGMRYTGTEIGGGKLSGQLELDFLGGKAAFGNGANMDLPRLRLAFGRLDWNLFSFEAGQDWSIFAPLNPTSYAEYAIPSMSASGNPWIRMPQIRAELHGKISSAGKMLLQLAAIDPDMGDYNTTTFSSIRTPGIGERGRAPGVEARLAFTEDHQDRDFTVAISSHYTHGKNSGTVNNNALQLPLDSWGVAADYMLPFTEKFNVSGELYTGRALGIFSVTSGEAILPLGGPGQAGVLSSGGWAQAEFNFTPRWQMNLVYGIDDPRVHDLLVGSRTRNQSYMTNLIWKYTAHVLFALEYRRLLTDFRNQPFANERGDTANLAVGYLF